MEQYELKDKIGYFREGRICVSCRVGCQEGFLKEWKGGWAWSSTEDRWQGQLLEGQASTRRCQRAQLGLINSAPQAGSLLRLPDKRPATHWEFAAPLMFAEEQSHLQVPEVPRSDTACGAGWSSCFPSRAVSPHPFPKAPPGLVHNCIFTRGQNPLKCTQV